MNTALWETLQSAKQDIEPRFKALRTANGALTAALKLAGEEKAEALLMQKALVKLEKAAQGVDDAVMNSALDAFAEATHKALDALSFEFARDLKDAFSARGQSVEGRPPTLVIGSLVLHIDRNARKAQWFYGKEDLTRPLPLTLSGIIKQFDKQQKAVVEREIDVEAFVGELYQAWRELLEQRTRRPAGDRINLVETYNKVILNRQTARFWNAPSRKTFKDYPRPLFVRDLVAAQQAPTLPVDGQVLRLRLGVATKSQAESSSRSVWIPAGPLDGEYYADLTFTET